MEGADAGSRECLPPVIVFDIGGTWFRSAVLSPSDELLSAERVPAMSNLRFPEASLDELQKMLVRYLVSDTERLRTQLPTATVGISLGAAINGLTGAVIGASPLWGATELLNFDLAAALRSEMPDCSWTILNDVAAAAVGLATTPDNSSLRRLAVLTVSSGLAMRTIEPAGERMPVNKDSGLQGEVGHLPATFWLKGRRISLRCACGVPDHLSAFSAGHGIATLLARLAEEGSSWLRVGQSLMEQFAQAVTEHQPEAREVLDAVTEPLAKTLLGVLAVDAEVERILLTGGVVEGLGAPYMESLLGHMATYGLYGTRLNSRDDFAEIVRRAPDAPSPTILGAAHCARRGSAVVPLQ